MAALRVLDLFCGCGGLSAGVRDAGFQIIAGVDSNPQYIQTFVHNFPDSIAICSDLSRMHPSELLRKIGMAPGDLDLLVGGPPCQGFSKNVPRARRQVDSGDNLLVEVFLSYCEHILPRCVVMENVAEMRNGFGCHYTNKIISRLGDAGYQVVHGIHNAADYGVPQRRRRAFFVGRRDGEVRLPAAAYSAQKEGLPGISKKHINVWDAIGDLRPLKNGEGVSPDIYASPPQSEYQERVRNKSNKVRNHVAKNLRPVQLSRISLLQPGQGVKDLPDELRPKAAYSGAYGRLKRDMVAPTITRWVFHPGSGRWGHPVDNRLITIREAARLHGFKDSFEFVGSYVQQAGQIGNAVPPLLAEKIAGSLL